LKTSSAKDAIKMKLYRFANINGPAVFAACVMLLGIARQAKAGTIETFTLSGVTLADGRTASGSFTFDFGVPTIPGTLGTISAVNLSAIGGSLLLPPETYTVPGNASGYPILSSPNIGFQFYNSDSSANLLLVVDNFSTSLSVQPLSIGNQIDGRSAERVFLVSGLVGDLIQTGSIVTTQNSPSGVPEPVTFCCLGLGIVCVGLMRHRKSA
jgi:hypothetical protein